jgi:hypothetical protein
MQTTPPCAEGLRWHLFTTHIPIPLSTVRKYEEKFVNITDPITGNVLPQMFSSCMDACSIVRGCVGACFMKLCDFLAECYLAKSHVASEMCMEACDGSVTLTAQSLLSVC